ncbi:L-rhamnose mutarotase [Sphingomonas sp. 37zxx]|uniref:L-rhamnose mutarotase n=1 Tax=Sphingomonas sp. 37zxx TaxID=1550073 RepID=UPI00068A643E|nr:L-rhamnose mutarotase [Sphingomonas sp. 37zxx]
MGDASADSANAGGTRHVLLLDLKDEAAAIARYEQAHRPGGVPASVVASIRTAGISDMRIYRCGNRLVMLMETDASFDPVAKAAADAANPDVQAWEALMDTLQQRLPFAAENEKWVAASPIFDLIQHIGD